jgi:hypothetical protein
MRKVFGVLCCLLIALPLAAQQRTGNIYGTVMDDQGTPLPGVSVTLTGVTIAPMATTTSSEGRFRFLSLFPANDYVLKAELAGFKTKIETGVIVNIGRNSDIMVVMEPGVLEEQVTVIAQTPMVDAKKTQVTHTVNYEMLQSLPSARDPWVILQMTPGIMMDRENIGGAESGQQSAFQSRGSTGQEWTIDGMQTTDRNSGGSPGYFDFDAFEELNISTGSLDVEHRDPGVVINIVTRRGGNKLSLGGRFYYSDKYMQGTVPQEKLNELNIRGFNQIRDIKDFGFNAGGPIVKDKAWWWGSYGVQQIQTINAINVNDDTYLNNYNAKVNLPAPAPEPVRVPLYDGGQDEVRAVVGRILPARLEAGQQVQVREPDLQVPGRAHVRRQALRLHPHWQDRRRIRPDPGERPGSEEPLVV